MILDPYEPPPMPSAQGKARFWPVSLLMLLRHENLSTTQAYLHPMKTDLADTLKALDTAWGEG